MGKLVKDMSEVEKRMQRNRAKKNYEIRVAENRQKRYKKLPDLIKRYEAESEKVKTSSLAVKMGLEIGKEILIDILSKRPFVNNNINLNQGD